MNNKRFITGKTAVVVALMLLVISIIAGCSGSSGSAQGKPQAGIAEAVGDYYLDLTDLGMKLTIYLRLSEDGTFIFSSTPEFNVNKSSGTYQLSDEGYLMVFTSVNGQEKSISDGLSSSFSVADDGSLDFSSCERIYYGSASATTTSDEHPGAKLTAIPITEDFVAPSDETDFTSGCYVTEDISDVSDCRICFYDDGSYLMSKVTNEVIISETGKYSVSTTQLALEPEGGSRISNEVVDDKHLTVSVFKDNDERENAGFTRDDEAGRQVIAVLEGTGKGTDGKEFTGTMSVYDDFSYEVSAAGFTERGVIVFNTEQGTYKIYPDHPDSGERGLLQVAAIPVGKLIINEDGNMTLEDLRVRTSESLNRTKCTFTEN